MKRVVRHSLKLMVIIAICAIVPLKRMRTARADTIVTTPAATRIPVGNTHSVVQDKPYLSGSTIEHFTFPSRATPESSNPAILDGILINRPNAQANLVICHGYGCDKDYSSFVRMLFPHYNVLVFDFRAHGQNSKKNNYCCTFGRDEMYDVLGAVDYLKSRPDLSHLPRFVYGFSMGAAASALAQSQDPTAFSALVLDCPYDRTENVIARGLDQMKFTIFGYTFDLPGRSLLQHYAFHPYVQYILKQMLKFIAKMDATATNTYIYSVSPMEAMKKITVPCYLIHCRNDEKIPLSMAYNNFNAAASPYCKLLITDGRGHFDSFFDNPEKYIFEVQQFFAKALEGKLQQKRAKIVEEADDKETIMLEKVPDSALSGLAESMRAEKAESVNQEK